MPYFNETKILEHRVKTGTDQLLAKSAVTSQNEPELAIAQLLLAAASLAMMSGMDKEAFCEGFVLALDETYNR